MTKKSLEEMMAEFEANGGQTTVLESSAPSSLTIKLGNLVKIDYAEHGGDEKGRTIFVVYLFEEQKTVRMLARQEDRAGVQEGKGYSFTYKPFFSGRNMYGGVNFVTRGVPTEIRAKKNELPSP